MRQPAASQVGEVVSKTLECEPRRWKIIERVREKFSCRDCEAITEAPAPSHPIPHTQSFAIVGGFAQDLHINDVSVSNAAKYCICFGAVRDSGINGLYAPNTNSDGVKIYGPALNVLVEDVSGVFGDDVCSFQNAETVSPFLGYNFTGGGDVIGCLGREISGNSPTSIAVMYSTPDGIMQNVGYDGIHGHADNTALRFFGSENVSSNIFFKNCDAFGGYVLNVDDGEIDVLTLENISDNHQANNPGPALAILAAATVRTLNIYTTRAPVCPALRLHPQTAI
jgi:hypothetical protein